MKLRAWLVTREGRIEPVSDVPLGAATVLCRVRLRPPTLEDHGTEERAFTSCHWSAGRGMVQVYVEVGYSPPSTVMARAATLVLGDAIAATMEMVAL